MRDRVTMAVLFLLVVVAMVLALTLPAHADGGVGVFLTRGQTDLGLTWSLALTKAPSVEIVADGLLAGNSYGIGVALPLAAITAPFLRALRLNPSDSFQNVLDAVQVGGAVLTENMQRFDLGFYAKVQALKVKF